MTKRELCMSTAITQILQAMPPAHVRAQAEAILSEQGISAEHALKLFYQQVVLDNGLPFTPGKVRKMPFPCLEDMTQEALEAHLEKGMLDVAAGRSKAAEDVFANLRQKLGL